MKLAVIIAIMIIFSAIRSVIEKLNKNTGQPLSEEETAKELLKKSMEDFKTQRYARKKARAYQKAQKKKTASKKHHQKGYLVDIEKEEEIERKIDEIKEKERLKRETLGEAPKPSFKVDRSNLRNAFIMKEIFLPPVSLREERDFERFD